MSYVTITPEAQAFLSHKDQRLKTVIEALGVIRRPLMPDPYLALLHSIVGQQISMKAQETVWTRLQAFLSQRGGLTPHVFLECAEDDLRALGLSARKISYMRGVATAFAQGTLSEQGLRNADDASVCQQLTSLNGIGRWTAEMILLFSLDRPNVLSWDDLAIRRGIRILYRHKDLTRQRFERYRKRYSPYGSVASLYLWAIAGGALPALTDPQRS